MSKIKFPTQYATGRNVMILLLLYLIFPMWALPRAERSLQEASGQPNFHPLDLRPGFSPDEGYAALEQLGPAGRDSYFYAETLMDVAYPLVYGVFFALLIAFLFRLVGGRLARMTAVAWLPLAGTLFDWLENLGIVRMIQAFPARADDWAKFASVMGQIKWVFSIIALLYILVGLGAWGLSVVKNPDMGKK